MRGNLLNPLTNLNVITGYGIEDGRADLVQIRLQRLEAGERQFDDCDLPGFDPLLVTQVLVAGDEYIEATVYQADQFAVLFSRPSLELTVTTSNSAR